MLSRLGSCVVIVRIELLNLDIAHLPVSETVGATRGDCAPVRVSYPQYRERSPRRCIALVSAIVRTSCGEAFDNVSYLLAARAHTEEHPPVGTVFGPESVDV